MPTWEDEPANDLLSLYETQCKHYGIKKQFEPETKPTDPEPALDGPAPVTRVPVPARKPVPVEKVKEVPAKSTPRNPGGSRDFRFKEDFDFEGTVHPSLPTSTVQAAVDARKDILDHFNKSTTSLAAPSTGANASRPSTPKRDTRRRADSGSSIRSLGSRTRSFTVSLKEKLSIVTMDKRERRDYERMKHRESGQASPSSAFVESPVMDAEQAALWAQGGNPSTLDLSKPVPSSMTKGQKSALEFSKKLDLVKSFIRPGTSESNMSWGMTDIAPEGVLDSCKRCNAPTRDHLKNGMCEVCNAEVKKMLAKSKGKESGRFVHPWQFPQGRLTWPDTQSPEQNCMKLAGKRKLMRVRQTIYEDPGNPFADELDGVEPSPSKSDGVDNGREMFWARGPLAPRRPSQVMARQRVALPRRKSIAGGLCMRGAQGNGQNDRESLTRQLHRSMSIAVPHVTPKEDTEEYIPPRAFWSREKPEQQQAEMHRTEDVRDTNFYGFYDDIMNNDRSRDSKAEMGDMRVPSYRLE